MKPIPILISLVILTLIGCTANNNHANSSSNGPSNVILIIGDGMGLSQLSSAFYYKNSAPNFLRFTATGLIITSSSKQKITDSASGATAFSTGHKTYNGAIGVDDDRASVATITEVLKEKMWASGIIATSSITHATPASFYAHVPDRNMYEEIAYDLSQSNIDFFAGGGRQFFENRSDGQNLVTAMESRGYQIDSILRPPKNAERIGYLLAEDALPTMLEGRGDFLQDASLAAIEFLETKSENYFLIVEGSQIDWGGHNKDVNYLISELIDLDNTIGEILDVIDPEETLVIVTADHETGGFTLSPAQKKLADGSFTSDYSEIAPTFSNNGHSASLIPVFAYGKSAEKFVGIYQNNEIYHKIMEAINQ